MPKNDKHLPKELRPSLESPIYGSDPDDYFFKDRPLVDKLTTLSKGLDNNFFKKALTKKQRKDRAIRDRAILDLQAKGGRTLERKYNDMNVNRDPKKLSKEI